MPRFAILLALATALVAGEAPGFTGRLVLKDASNADKAVATTAQDGVPQGHVLKVCLEEGRHGKRMAAGQAVSLRVTRAQVEVATAEGALDANGYGELLVPIGLDWTKDVHQVHLRLGKAGQDGHETGLGGTFRVVEGEPGPFIPEGWPVIIVLAGLGLFLLWWRRPQAAPAL